MSRAPIFLSMAALLCCASAPCEAASLAGRIAAGADVQTPAPLSVAVDDWVCGKDGSLPDPRLVIGAERGLANVVVRIDAQGPPYPSEGRATIDQRGCVFEPHVVVVAPGQELLARNTDPVLHNFRTISSLNRKVNKAQVRASEDVFRFQDPEIIQVACDVHYWMSAVIVIAKNAFTAVTGIDGTFAIDGLKPGSYRVELWHEQLGTKTADALVGENGGRLDLTWSAD